MLKPASNAALNSLSICNWLCNLVTCHRLRPKFKLRTSTSFPSTPMYACKTSVISCLAANRNWEKNVDRGRATFSTERRSGEYGYTFQENTRKRTSCSRAKRRSWRACFLLSKLACSTAFPFACYESNKEASLDTYQAPFLLGIWRSRTVVHMNMTGKQRKNDLKESSAVSITKRL